jgi:hypothetical protein
VEWAARGELPPAPRHRPVAGTDHHLGDMSPRGLRGSRTPGSPGSDTMGRESPDEVVAHRAARRLPGTAPLVEGSTIATKRSRSRCGTSAEMSPRRPFPGEDKSRPSSGRRKAGSFLTAWSRRAGVIGPSSLVRAPRASPRGGGRSKGSPGTDAPVLQPPTGRHGPAIALRGDADARGGAGGAVVDVVLSRRPDALGPVTGPIRPLQGPYLVQGAGASGGGVAPSSPRRWRPGRRPWRPYPCPGAVSSTLGTRPRRSRRVWRPSASPAATSFSSRMPGHQSATGWPSL